MKRVFILVILGFLLVSSFFTGCGSTKIRVGSFMDPEGILMAQLIIQMLQKNGFDAVDMGSYDDVYNTLKDGKIDIYPDYTGYLSTKGDDILKYGVELKPAPADSKWAIVITENLSKEENIKNMSEFAAYVNSGKGPLKLICSPDFISDEYALPAFERVYGFVLEPEQMLIVPSYNFVYMWTQVLSPDNDLNAAIAYTTGGKPEEYNLVLLDDDKEAQPEFNPVPIVRKQIYGKYTERLNRILTPLFASLTNGQLRDLESRSGLAGKQSTAEIARQYLVENGYFAYNELEMVQKAIDDMKGNKHLDTVPAHLEATSDMSVFPSKEYPLYSKDPSKAYFTWRLTSGTYTCDDKGFVTQVSTGW